MSEKVQMNMRVEPDVPVKVDELGRLTQRSLQGDVITWLVRQAYADLIEKPAQKASEEKAQPESVTVPGNGRHAGEE